MVSCCIASSTFQNALYINSPFTITFCFKLIWPLAVQRGTFIQFHQGEGPLATTHCFICLQLTLPELLLLLLQTLLQMMYSLIHIVELVLHDIRGFCVTIYTQPLDSSNKRNYLKTCQKPASADKHLLWWSIQISSCFLAVLWTNFPAFSSYRLPTVMHPLKSLWRHSSFITLVAKETSQSCRLRASIRTHQEQRTQNTLCCKISRHCAVAAIKTLTFLLTNFTGVKFRVSWTHSLSQIARVHVII